MTSTYHDLIHQTFYFPQEGFSVENNSLFFNDINLLEVIREHGTPLKITYLPKITQQIQKARRWFSSAFENHKYPGKYYYCYCTKSSHFEFVLSEVLKNKAQLETSYAYDLEIIKRLYEKGKLDKNITIVCNGYKTMRYSSKIAELINSGFRNMIPVLDNMHEINYYDSIHVPCNVGIRIASEEEPTFAFYTSRLGIRWKDIFRFYTEHLRSHPFLKLKMLHFFIDTGIKDTAFYWSELNKALKVYTTLKRICPELDTFNIGGGFPFKNSLGFEYDYEYMVNEIVSQIKSSCDSAGVQCPNIFTEFGNYTVAESGATIFSVLGQKQQNDRELWYMIDGSLITTLPDTWGINQRFILLPVNHWERPHQRVNIGGLSCDNDDYYDSEVHINEVFLPKVKVEEPLYIGFFHTGAYQEAISGYGGIKHCLIPSPKHLLIDKENGVMKTHVFAEEQTAESMLKILGY